MRILRRFAGNSSISRDLQNCKNVSIWQKVVNIYYIEKVVNIYYIEKVVNIYYMAESCKHILYRERLPNKGRNC